MIRTAPAPAGAVGFKKDPGGSDTVCARFGLAILAISLDKKGKQR